MIFGIQTNSQHFPSEYYKWKKVTY